MESSETLLSGRRDTPRATYGLLPRRVTLTIVATLLGLATLGWIVTIRQADSMSGVVTGLGQVGVGMSGDMAIPLFMGTWLAMMVAMMFPAVAPMVLAHRLVVKRRGHNPKTTAVFVAGYLFVWSLIGVAPLLAFLWFRNLSGATQADWLPTLAGGVIALAGAYQFTSWKALCLKTCRNPLSFVLHHDFGGGAPAAFRAGVSHGAYCLGCCWALMAVLLVVGLMNLAWMALLATVFLIEKHWRHAVGFTRATGAALIVLGLAIVVRPTLLPTLSGTGGGMPTMGDHISP